MQTPIMFLVSVILVQFFIPSILPAKRCTTPNNENAQCISIYECGVLYNSLTSKDPQVLRFLNESQCDYIQVLYVCCGSVATYQQTFRPENIRPPTSTGVSHSNLLPNRESCGFQEATKIFGGDQTTHFGFSLLARNLQTSRPTNPRLSRGRGGKPSSLLPTCENCGYQEGSNIFGGVPTTIFEFPWMALMVYRNNVGGGRTFACGGALITSKHILSAAHCVTGKIREQVGPLVSVRLGEWNTETTQDCVDLDVFQLCNEEPINVPVESYIAHSEYDDSSINRYNDIALIRLSRSVQFTDFIQPICLPTPSGRPAIGSKLWIAGWGITEDESPSSVKLKVELPIVSNSQCSTIFRTANATIASTQLCAGGELNKDSCSGDSGGPLMQVINSDSNPQWYVEGVVSYGTNCGTENWPGVYTRVVDYLDWINENLVS